MKSEYENLVDENKDNWKILMEVANRYAYNCSYEDAISLYEQTFAASPKPRFTDELACIRFLYKSLGKNDLAVEACYRELELLKDEWNITKGELVDNLKEEISQLQANSTK